MGDFTMRHYIYTTLCAAILVCASSGLTPEEDFTEAYATSIPPMPPVGMQIYHVSIGVAMRRHAGTKNTISVQLENASGGKTPWAKLSEGFKTGQKLTKSISLENIGGASAISLVRLRTNGKDGLLLEDLAVETGSSKKSSMQKQRFSGGKRFLMCRREDPPSTPNACSMTFPRAAALSAAHACKQCKSVLPMPPHPLKSNFQPPARGTGTHRYSLRRKRGSSSARVQYDGFTVWLDCTRNAAYRFEYMAYEDCGCYPRHHGFKVDPNADRIGRSCQQRNGRAYKKTQGVAFDRGHLVPANHLDHDEDAITQSNYMTNILPQAALMNRGAWLESEELVECLRDKEPVHVLGGAVWDPKDPRRKWFQRSHNVVNPSFFWKVVTVRKRHKEDHHRIAFWFPNNEVAKRGTIGKYVVSIATLEARLKQFGQGQTFAIPKSQKSHLPAKPWNHIKGCDKSE